MKQKVFLHIGGTFDGQSFEYPEMLPEVRRTIWNKRSAVVAEEAEISMVGETRLDETYVLETLATSEKGDRNHRLVHYYRYAGMKNITALLRLFSFYTPRA